MAAVRDPSPPRRAQALPAPPRCCRCKGSGSTVRSEESAATSRPARLPDLPLPPGHAPAHHRPPPPPRPAAPRRPHLLRLLLHLLGQRVDVAKDGDARVGEPRPPRHLHHQAAPRVLQDVARLDGERREAEDGVPSAVGGKVDEGTKGVPRAAVVHPAHDRAQVRKLRLLHEVAHRDGGRGQLAAQRRVLHAAAERGAVQARRLDRVGVGRRARRELQARDCGEGRRGSRGRRSAPQRSGSSSALRGARRWPPPAGAAPPTFRGRSLAHRGRIGLRLGGSFLERLPLAPSLPAAAARPGDLTPQLPSQCERALRAAANGYPAAQGSAIHGCASRRPGVPPLRDGLGTGLRGLQGWMLEMEVGTGALPLCAAETRWVTGL